MLPSNLDEVVTKMQQSGDIRAALQPLRLAWAETRNSDIATLVEELASLLETDIREMSLEQADFGDPDAGDVDRLLAFAAQFVIEDQEGFIRQMCEWTPDPRIVRSMVEKIEDPELGGRGNYWAAVYDLLVINADPRFTNLVTARAELGKDSKRDRAEGREARRVKDAYTAASAGTRDLSLSEHETLRRLEVEVRRWIAPRQKARKHSQSSREEVEWKLVDAIVAELDADEPRLVYADWLIENNDPRGQLISLMIELTKGKRVKGKIERLLRNHDRELLGNLFGHVRDKVFDRGLLKEVGLWNLSSNWPTKKIDALVTDIRWRTVEVLRHVSTEDNARWVLQRASLDSLRRVDDVSLRNLIDLATRPDAGSLRLEGVYGLFVGDDDAELIDTAAAIPDDGLPELIEVEWNGASGGPPAGLSEIGLFRRVKTSRRSP